MMSNQQQPNMGQMVSANGGPAGYPGDPQAQNNWGDYMQTP